MIAVTEIDTEKLAELLGVTPNAVKALTADNVLVCAERDRPGVYRVGDNVRRYCTYLRELLEGPDGS